MERAGVLIRRSAAVSLDPVGASRCAARVARMRAVCRFITYPVQPRRVLPVGCANWPRRSVLFLHSSVLTSDSARCSRCMRCGRWGSRRGVNYRRISFCPFRNSAWILDDSLCQEVQIGSTRDKIFYTIYTVL
jgi:hypothetical protein